MITTSQGWKDNQQQQLRSESNVRITFYSINNYKIVSTLGTIDKKNLQNFSFCESGSIICNQRYDVDIRFSLLKFSTNKIDFPNGSLIKIEFGYFINNAWEYISRGYFEIVDVVNKANSFTIDYVAKHINYKLFSQDYKLGMLVVANQTDMSMQNFVNASIKGLLNDYESTKTSFLKGDLTITGDISAWFTDNYLGANDFPTMPYLDIFQVVSQSQGCSYRINGTTNASDEYFTDWKLIDFLHTDFTSVDFSFKKYDINFLKHPEIIEQEKIKQTNWYYQTTGYFSESGSGNATATLQNVTKVAYFPTNFRNQTFKYGYKYCFTGGVVGTYSPQTTFKGTNTTFNSEEHYGGVYGGVLDPNATAELKSSNPLTLNDAYGWSTFNNSLIKQWVNSNLVYDLDLRIDPSVELYDKVAYDRGNEYINGQWFYYGVRDCIVESYTIRFNGAFNGTMRIRDNLNLFPPLASASCYNDDNGTEQYYIDINNASNNVAVTAKVVNENGYVYGSYNIIANDEIEIDNYDYNNMSQDLISAFNDYWYKYLDKSVYVYFEHDNNKSSKILLLQKNDDITEVKLPSNAKDLFQLENNGWYFEMDDQPNPFALSFFAIVDDHEQDRITTKFIQPLGYGYFESGDLTILDDCVELYNKHELERKVYYKLTDFDDNVESEEILILEPNIEHKRLVIFQYNYSSPTSWSIGITNPYNTKISLHVYCNNEIHWDCITINANSSVLLTANNCSFLSPYMQIIRNREELDYDVGFFATIYNYGVIPTSTIPIIFRYGSWTGHNTKRTPSDLLPYSSSIGYNGSSYFFKGANANSRTIIIYYEYQGVEHSTGIRLNMLEVVNGLYNAKYFMDETLAQIRQLYENHQLADDVYFYGRDESIVRNKTNIFYTIMHNNS